MNLGVGPSADINSACMKGEVGSQEPSSFVYLFSSLNWEVILQFVIFFPISHVFSSIGMKLIEPKAPSYIEKKFSKICLVTIYHHEGASQ